MFRTTLALSLIALVGCQDLGNVGDQDGSARGAVDRDETDNPTPETAPPTPDNSTQEPDNATQEPDNATQEPDNATQEPDNATQEPDNATQEPDNATAPPTDETCPDQGCHNPPDECDGYVDADGNCVDECHGIYNEAGECIDECIDGDCEPDCDGIYNEAGECIDECIDGDCEPDCNGYVDDDGNCHEECNGVYNEAGECIDECIDGDCEPDCNGYVDDNNNCIDECDGIYNEVGECIDECADGDCEPDSEPFTPMIIQDCATDDGYVVTGTSGDLPEGQPLVWGMGVYETRSDHSGDYHPMGEAHVLVEREGQHALVFASYEPTTWNVEVLLGDVEFIAVYGYHGQVVQADPSIPVFDMGAPNYPLSNYDWDNGSDVDFSDILGLASQYGFEGGRFEACYRATDFVIGESESNQPAPEPTVENPLGVPTSDVPCGPGETVELARFIPADEMALGASNTTGPGWCSGFVTFGEDGSVDENTQEVNSFEGFATSCNAVHCNDVMYGDGDIQEQYCSLTAICEDGLARSTGYTW